MIMNFKTREINRNTRKLTQTSTLITKKILTNMQEFSIYLYMY
jgi:hypothetical protein